MYRARTKLLSSSIGLLFLGMSAQAAISFSPSSAITLSVTEVGKTGTATSVSIKNSSTRRTSSCGNPVLSGTNVSQFVVAGGNLCTGGIAGRGSCGPLTITPRPTYSGSKSASLKITCGSYSASLALSYTAIAAPTPTPTPVPTATPKPTATPTPVPTVTPKPTVTPTPVPTATPKPTATPTPAPTATPTPIPTATPAPTPSTIVATFNPVVSGPLAAAMQSAWIPSPWLADHCGANSLTADTSGTKFVARVIDGCRWSNISNPSVVYDYARAEVGLTGGTKAFPTGKMTTVEWKGYFTKPLPPVGRRDTFVSPMQVHNKNGLSPMFGFEVNVRTQQVVLTMHDTLGALLKSVPIASYAAFLNTSRTLRLNIYMSTGNDGSVSVDLDGIRIYTETGIPTTNTPGEDYVKFGIYDWGRGLVDPLQPERGRVFELVTEAFKVYR